MNQTAPTLPTAPAAPSGKGARVLAVTSGKGGVGKTFMSANLAAALAKRNLKVLVLDADLGLANLDVVLNLYPKITLHDVFTGKARLDEAVLPAPGGFHVLLAGSGMIEYSRLTSSVREQLNDALNQVKPKYDVIILDTGAGISDVVLYAVSLADEVLVVATPEPTSLTDAYATIKVLAAQQKRHLIRIVINQTLKVGDGRAIVAQLQRVLDRFIGSSTGTVVKLSHVGDVPSDPAVREAVQRRQLLMTMLPGCQAGVAVGALSQRVQDLLVSP